jgi:hypothetical protein
VPVGGTALAARRAEEPVMDSAAMINRCFRHQHPEAYGEMEECLLEDALGFPDAVPLAPY